MTSTADDLAPRTRRRRPLTTVPDRELLPDLAAHPRRFVHFGHFDDAFVIGLFAMHAQAIRAAETTPYLYINSPTKRCGKSRLLKLISQLVPGTPEILGTATEASLFNRTEHYFGRALLLDEVDVLLRPGGPNAEGLRGFLDTGHERGIVSSRLTLDGKMRQYRTFGPKVLAGISRVPLPDTIADRAISIVLPRKARGQDVERYRRRDVQGLEETLRKRLEGWATKSTVDALAKARPTLPQVNDRAADGWEPFCAIAEHIGGDWPERVRAIAERLHPPEEDDTEESPGDIILSAIRDAMDRGHILGRDAETRERPTDSRLKDIQWGDPYARGSYKGASVWRHADGRVEMRVPWKEREQFFGRLRVRGARVDTDQALRQLRGAGFLYVPKSQRGFSYAGSVWKGEPRQMPMLCIDVTGWLLPGEDV